MSEQKPEFTVRITGDRMAVVLDCKVDGSDWNDLLTRIEAELALLGVTGLPPRRELEARLSRALQNGGCLTNEALLEGKRPIPPVDAKIEWAGDFFKTGFAVDEKTGAIDYRRRLAQRAVDKDRLLASATNPKDGQDGVDVFGKPIPAGKPRRIRISAGPNVRVEKKGDTSHFYAITKGHLRWSANTLAVDEAYHIPGSVGIETGDIKHPGTVLIEGDVLAGSRIEAGGDIEVMGTVEAADIRAGGNLTVRGGITGVGNRGVNVGGGVCAKFILEADISAGEDIVVEVEIVQSTLKTRGSIVMPAGRLIGGSATALGGIVVGQAGSNGLVPTLLTAAEDYSYEERRSAIQTKIFQHTRNLEKIHRTVDPLMAKEKSLTRAQREAATELLARASEMEMTVKELRTEMEEFEDDSRSRSKPRILINRSVYPDTTLRIKQASLLITEGAQGPLRAGLVGGRLVLLTVEKASAKLTT